MHMLGVAQLAHAPLATDVFSAVVASSHDRHVVRCTADQVPEAHAVMPPAVPTAPPPAHALPERHASGAFSAPAAM
jgi:hypothetical protein